MLMGRIDMSFPVYVENSRIPKWLSYVSPIEPYAVSFGFWVWCRGTMSATLRNHEHIHFRQQIWMAFVFQWLAYLLWWVVLYAYFRDGVKAYRRNPFELEAYDNQGNMNYINERKRYGWTSYIKKAFKS